VIGIDNISRETMALTVLGLNQTWGMGDIGIYMVTERYDISWRHRLTVR
jgi:hypothetical protein